MRINQDRTLDQSTATANYETTPSILKMIGLLTHNDAGLNGVKRGAKDHQGPQDDEASVASGKQRWDGI